MPDNFLYSEQTGNGYTNMVTAEDLNYIAVDLGIPDYSRFPEEPPQSAVSALNAITMDLTSKGILQIGSCMNVTVSDNVITVADGVCVMDNGAKKRLTEPVNLPCIEGGTNYVYILNNIAGNQIQIINSLEVPGEDNDYVMLAEVNSGSVTDKRYWSISKVGSGVNIAKEYTMQFVYKPMYYDENLGYQYQKTEYIIDIPFGVNFFITTINRYSEYYPLAFHLTEGKAVECRLDKYDKKMFVEKEGAILHISTYLVSGNQTNSTSADYETRTFTLA